MGRSLREAVERRGRHNSFDSLIDTIYYTPPFYISFSYTTIIMMMADLPGLGSEFREMKGAGKGGVSGIL